jgi:hypothetical protein
MTPEMFRKLSALGLSNDQMAGVLEIFENDAATRKEKARSRVQKWRDNRKGNVTERYETSRNATDDLTRGDVKQNNLETPNVSKKEISAPKALSEVAAFKAELTFILDEDRIAALCSIRKQKKAGFSASAGRGLAKKLSQFPNIKAVVDEMIVRGWVGIEPSWLNGRNLGTPAPKPKSEFMQHQDDVQRELDKALGRKRDDEFTGNTLDLETGNWRAH